MTQTSKRIERESRKARRGAPFSAKTSGRIVTAAREAAAYYRAKGRDFPWRHESDCFRLAVAEILLQKTRADATVAVYRDLIGTYPTAETLSNADIHDLQHRLRPLGLSGKRAAQLVGLGEAVVRHGDSIFHDWKRLLSDVPGMGTYGARALACFGRGERVGIVDANIARIVRRLFGIPSSDPRAVAFQRYADAIAMASDDARATNFGLLDVGATICLPNPRCSICPLESGCAKYGVSGVRAQTGARKKSSR